MNLKFIGGLTALLVIFGCGGAGAPYVPDVGNTATSFVINGPAGANTVVQGQSVTILLQVVLAQATQGRSPAPVTLSVTGLPLDSTATFSANPVTPTEAGTAVNLVVQTSNIDEGDKPIVRRTPAGTFTLTVTGSNGTDTRTRTVTLVVNPENGAFTLNVEVLDGQMTDGPITRPGKAAKSLIPDDTIANYRVNVEAPDNYRGMVRLEYRFTQAGAPTLQHIAGDWFHGLLQTDERSPTTLVRATFATLWT